jgi:hypothetical protein
LPEDISALYNEARKAAQARAFTPCVLACRKVLMHVAREKGAPDGANFVACVNHLENGRFIPPNARPWVDEIRSRSNEANHEVVLMSNDDALHLLDLAQMLLAIVYEYPAKARKK